MTRERTVDEREKSHAVSRRALRDKVYEALLDMILAGTVRPGQRLRTEALAADLNVSATPVREALAHLETSGLVVREGYKGHRVADPLSEEQRLELMDMRTVLEVQAARWAAGKLPDLLQPLRDAHDRQVAAAAEITERLRHEHVDLPGYREFYSADEEFHHAIFEHADNRYLLQMATGLGAHLHRMRQTLLEGDYDYNDAVAEHEAILRAAEAGDPRRFVDAMQRHMLALRDRVSATRSKHTGSPIKIAPPHPL